MQEYLDMIEYVFDHGQRKENRTGVDTLSVFNYNYSVNLQEGFPLLTTKDMSGYIWNSLIHELLWYLSGEHHIREFTEKSGIWDDWADDDLNLETAYGRFWRRFPVSDYYEQLPGEEWASAKDGEDHLYVNIEESPKNGRRMFVFDQIAYIVDTLLNNPYSRRMVLSAWHPSNASVSKLPPCHYSAVFNVTPNDGGRDYLNCHLTQRSGDLGLGIPFNIASYSALTHILAKASGFQPGHFAHTIVDLHIYCGDGEEDPHSHVPQLKEQKSREPKSRPELHIQSDPPEKGEELEWIETLEFNDFELTDYDPHDRLAMKVAV